MPMDGLRMDEQAEEWWKEAGDQNGSSSAQWTNANDQTAWEPEGPIGGLEMNSIEEVSEFYLRYNCEKKISRRSGHYFGTYW